MKIKLLKPLLSVALLLNLITATSAIYAETPAIKSRSETSPPKVLIENAWVRATNKGQSVGAAYMTLTSQQDLSLFCVTSDVTDNVEIHNMAMQNGIMKMRMLDSLAIKANKPTQLAPGGFHLMLFDLEKPLIKGEKIHFTLKFEDKNGAVSEQKTIATVK
ncbi:MAG: copper chaperone PCu(A)C [Methylotenera sp.]|nr:copper chaperone PCu(A)C [Methylotenera sp.]